MKTIDRRIAEFKLRAAPVNYAYVPVNQRGQITTNFLEDLDKRIISGYLITWNTVNMHGEMFIRGCCAKSIQDRGPNSVANYKLTFLNQHDTTEALAQFDELVEDEIGLRFRTKPLDPVPWADYVLAQVRSGTLNQFSPGFDYIWDKIEWDDKNDCIVCKEIDLFEGSIVTIASDQNTFVIRSAEKQEEFFDEIEAFIGTLPRKNQLQARQYITKLKSLIDFQPDQQRTKPLETDKPKKEAASIDYNYLINNL